MGKMDQLNITDTDLVKEIINIGLAKAGDALAMVINEKVLIKCVELISLGDAFLEVDDDHINLSSEINGDIQGICYFIINKQDAAYLVSKVIPNSHSGDQFEIDEMSTGFLLELDNIIGLAAGRVAPPRGAEASNSGQPVERRLHPVRHSEA